ncbi:MAG TPA: uracil-DNA glycosylase [Candidatus Tumulicola sp.]|nr:uracil-DNA glycosylase [Candidatus Tumulicola sp.]
MNDDRAAALERLHQTVDACRRCAIGSTRTKVVCGVGDPHSPLVIVGEGPGENEDRQGEPFVGRAGELLTRMLAAIGLRREDVFITNTIKCRATTEENGRVFNRAPMQEEMANCREYLDIELSVLKPRVVLALGAPAAKSFQGAGFSITRQRGVWYPGPLGSDLIVTFHPAYILRLTGGNINAVKKLVWSDLQAVQRRLAGEDETAEAGLKSGIPQEPELPDQAASEEQALELKFDL